MDTKGRESSQVHGLLAQSRALIESSVERTRLTRLVVRRAKAVLANSEAVRAAAEAGGRSRAAPALAHQGTFSEPEATRARGDKKSRRNA